MKKNFKKSKFVILPALATLVLTGVASVTGTVAWFTANTRVTAEGMKFTAKSGSNLLIASDTLTNAAQLEDSKFTSSLNLTDDAKTLNPASTIDAKNFFYTNSAKADGSKESGDYQAATNNASVAYYVDYVFELKAINTEATAQNIYVDNLEIKYNDNYANGTLAEAVKSFRAAFFIEAAGETKNNAFKLGTATDNVDVKHIYTPAGAANQTDGKAVKSATELDAVTYVTTQTTSKELISVQANSTKYYKAICRVWLEGEDKSCTSELFSTAAKSWSVNLGLTLSTTTETMDSKVITNIKVADTTQAPQQ